MTGRAAPAGRPALAAAVAARAAAEGDRVALCVDGGDALTYTAWGERSSALARGLAGRGVERGALVCVLFDSACWPAFAVAHLGVVKAGGVPVLVSAGAPAADVARTVAHSGAVGLLCPPHLAPRSLPVWVAHPDDVAAAHDAASGGAEGEPAEPAEVVYLPTPLGALRPWHRRLTEVADEAALDGWLVHAWAPGTLAGRHALRLVSEGVARGAATLPAFDPDRLCALVAARRATALGLTPALAAALLASGAPGRHDVASVARVLVGGEPSAGVRAGLAEAFPAAAVVDLDGASPTGEAPGAGGAERAPVAVSQEGMLWHEQFAPGSFNLPCLVRRFQGRLDAGALEGALSELARRHQPLRATFELPGGEPLQVVPPHLGLPLGAIDLSGLAQGARDQRVSALLADASTRPFDLGTGPVFEPRLVRLGDDEHLLVVRLHHTAFDDWSVDVFRRELSALYGAKVSGSPSPLVEPAVSFAELCRRQRARLAGEAGAAQRPWWRRELAGAPLAVQLPGGDGPPAPGQPLRLDLPPELAAAVRALAPRLRATPYMTVLAAFSVLVSRATGLDDLVMATVVAHRNSTAAEALVGCFTKKLPLRLRLDGDPTFAELVARTRGSLLGALSHQDLPFDAVVHDALGPAAAEHGVVPQVAVVFQGEAPRQARLALPGLTVAPFEVPAESRRERHFTARDEEAGGDEDDGPRRWGDGAYPGTFLILSLLEAGSDLALIARGSFHRPTVRRLLEDLEAVLAGATASPDRAVSALGPPPARAGDDVVELRGFRARRSRLEAALARCPGVAEVAVSVAGAGGEPRLVAYVVAGAGEPPTLGQLRRTLWRQLPGVPWPAALVVVDALPRLADGRLDVAALPPPAKPGAAAARDPEPDAVTLAAMWGEVAGRPVTRESSYWQDFSFLRVLVEAREAGLALTDEQVARNRTPSTLVADLAASRGRVPRSGAIASS